MEGTNLAFSSTAQEHPMLSAKRDPPKLKAGPKRVGKTRTASPFYEQMHNDQSASCSARLPASNKPANMCPWSHNLSYLGYLGFAAAFASACCLSGQGRTNIGILMRQVSRDSCACLCDAVAIPRPSRHRIPSSTEPTEQPNPHGSGLNRTSSITSRID